MRKSINAWTFLAGTSVAEMASRAAAAGFEALELVVDREGELTPETSEADCVALRDTVRGAGLVPVSLATGLFWQENYGSADPAARRRAIDLTRAMLDRAAWIGAQAILVIPAVVGRAADAAPITRYTDALNHTEEALHRLALDAEDRGVRIGIENVWNRFLLSPVELADLIDRLSTPWVGAYFDVGNVMPFGYPQDWIDTLGPRIVRVHVKDYALARPGPAGFCPLGEGDVDWPAVLAALDRAGYAGPLTYEGPGDPGDIARRMDACLVLPSALD